ncbi:MAG: 16S rRNA (cytosine(967)-C(5))-methyltransferase RsmB [Bacillota bacterium]
MKGSSASGRQLALVVLNRVLEGGAFADIALTQALSHSSLPRLERSLATELVYGCLRRLNTLDFVLQARLSRHLADLPPSIRNVLRLGAYQLLFMRVPAYAGVNECVELAKRMGHRGTAALVNGVLRRLAREAGSIHLLWDQQDDPIRRLSLETSVPEWVCKLWTDYLGHEAGRQLCCAISERPPLNVRANTLKTERGSLKRALESEGIRCVECSMAPEGLTVEEDGEVCSTSAFQQGLFYVQDEASMLVSHAVRPEPGTTVVDLCAGPGGKTTHMAALMGNEGRLIAFEINKGRLDMVVELCKRLGVGICEPHLGDARNLAQQFRATAHSVLVDAPCSGLGVLRRRVDLKWRMSPDRIEGLVQLQRQLLVAGAECVRPGGALVYSTCTVNPAENEGMVDWFLKLDNRFVLEDLSQVLDWLPESAFFRGFLRLLPSVHGTDGFFVARMVRRG